MILINIGIYTWC